MVLSLKERVKATRLRQEEKRLRKISQRSQSRSGGGVALANDEELARSFSGTASVDKRSHLESESLGKAKVGACVFIHSTVYHSSPIQLNHKTQSQTTVTAATTTTSTRLVQSSDMDERDERAPSTPTPKKRRQRKGLTFSPLPEPRPRGPNHAYIYGYPNISRPSSTATLSPEPSRTTFDSAPSSEAPLTPAAAVEVGKKRKRLGKNKGIPIQREQVPLVPALWRTTHSIQGVTADVVFVKPPDTPS